MVDGTGRNDNDNGESLPCRVWRSVVVITKPGDKVAYFGDGPRDGQILVFHCPGCKQLHLVEIVVPNGTGWSWNSSMTAPTFSPSLLCNQHDLASRCHSFIENGYIQFLSDCYHELKGQTVEIPEWE